MPTNYIYVYSNVVSTTLFLLYKIVLILLVISQIYSLVMLAIGCLIKSQKIKSKYIAVTPILLLGCISFIVLPYIYTYFNNKKIL